MKYRIIERNDPVCPAWREFYPEYRYDWFPIWLPLGGRNYSLRQAEEQIEFDRKRRAYKVITIVHEIK